jgi:hypothetical protein
MSTTSWNISKQLAEAGFEATYDTYALNPDNFITGQKYPSYDFETILTALPNAINAQFTRNLKRKYELRVWFEADVFIGYQNCQGFHPQFTFKQRKDETLADVAGKLWLELKKVGLV